MQKVLIAIALFGVFALVLTAITVQQASAEEIVKEPIVKKSYGGCGGDCPYKGDCGGDGLRLHDGSCGGECGQKNCGCGR